jgi:outer membrane receptor protein involved in Fe transport
VFTGYTRGDLVYDYDVTFGSVSPYLQAEANPVERVHLTAGLRYDRMGFTYDSRLDELQTGRWRRPADAEVEYGHLSPKLGATYEFSRAVNVYANYAHGFRAPSEGQLFRQGSAVNTVDLQPVIANSVEAGVRGVVLGLAYSLTGYRMIVQNDVLAYVQPDGTRETQNAGKTLHHGIEAGIGAELARGLRADVSYSLAEHVYRAWSPRPEVDYGGNEIESAPNVLLNARLSYAPAFLPGGRVAAEWSRVGGYWLDAENTHRYDGHHLLNVHANLPLTGRVEAIGRVLNLLDDRYAESAAYTAARGEEFAPGMPRTVYLGVQYRWSKEGGR